MPQPRHVSTTGARRIFLWTRRALVGCACLATSWTFYLRHAPNDRRLSLRESTPLREANANDDAGGGPADEGIPYEEPVVDTSAADSAKASPEEQQRQAVVGQWEDDYQGKRYLTLRDDGTAVMVVEPAGIGKTLFAAKLVFDAEWKIEEGKLHMWTKGGEPKGKVQMVLKMFGNHAEQEILELTDDRLRLLDENGRTEYEWRRILSVADAGE